MFAVLGGISVLLGILTDAPAQLEKLPGWLGDAKVQWCIGTVIVTGLAVALIWIPWGKRVAAPVVHHPQLMRIGHLHNHCIHTLDFCKEHCKSEEELKAFMANEVENTTPQVITRLFGKKEADKFKDARTCPIPS